MEYTPRKTFGYDTYLMLKEQQHQLETQVRTLYDRWRYMDCVNIDIKDNYPQSKILFSLEGKLYFDKYHPCDSRDRVRMEKRCINLKKRIEERFLEEYPERVRNTLEAYNLYLLNQCRLNALRVCVTAYHSALTDL